MGLRRLWKPVSIVTSLLLLLTICCSRVGVPTLAMRARMQEALQGLQLHDTELTPDVLLALTAGFPERLPTLREAEEVLSEALITEAPRRRQLGGRRGAPGPLAASAQSTAAPPPGTGALCHTGQSAGLTPGGAARAPACGRWRGAT
jgi:hypothetical protein